MSFKDIIANRHFGEFVNAGIIASLAAIAIFGSSVLEKFGDSDDHDFKYRCSIGYTAQWKVDTPTNATHHLEVGLRAKGPDPENFLFAAQLVFIIAFVANEVLRLIMAMFIEDDEKVEDNQGYRMIKPVLECMYTVAALLFGYAAITTDCIGTSGAEHDAFLNKSAEKLAVSFLVFSIFIVLRWHDLFKGTDASGGSSAMENWSHVTSFLDNAVRLIAYAMLTAYLNNNDHYEQMDIPAFYPPLTLAPTEAGDDPSTFSPTDAPTPAPSGAPFLNCIDVAQGLEESRLYPIVPWRPTAANSNPMATFAIVVLVFVALEMVIRIMERVFHYENINYQSTAKFMYYAARFYTAFSRLATGLFLCGFIIANESVSCHHFVSNAAFRTTTVFLLLTYVTGYADFESARLGAYTTSGHHNSGMTTTLMYG